MNNINKGVVRELCFCVNQLKFNGTFQNHMMQWHHWQMFCFAKSIIVGHSLFLNHLKICMVIPKSIPLELNQPKCSAQCQNVMYSVKMQCMAGVYSLITKYFQSLPAMNLFDCFGYCKISQILYSGLIKNIVVIIAKALKFLFDLNLFALETKLPKTLQKPCTTLQNPPKTLQNPAKPSKTVQTLHNPLKPS